MGQRVKGRQRRQRAPGRWGHRPAARLLTSFDSGSRAATGEFFGIVIMLAGEGEGEDWGEAGTEPQGTKLGASLALIAWIQREEGTEAGSALICRSTWTPFAIPPAPAVVARWS